MDKKELLTKYLDENFRFQKILFYGVSLVTGITGIAILILSLTVPAKPGEEQIMFWQQVTSVIFIIFAVAFPLYIRKRLNQVKDLLFNRPQDIVEVKPVTVTKRGVPGYAIRLITKDKKTAGFNVKSPKSQANLVIIIKDFIS